MDVRAYAKINWDLHIQGKRGDGFHAIDTVMVNVSLFDVLRFEASDTVTLTCSDPTLPTDDGNLVVRAAKRLRELSGVKSGAKIHLEKKIPAGGGMGGGSSDCARTLLALNECWKLGWPVERLAPIAAELGSDIAFFLYGGWCRCSGRGEIVERIPNSERFPEIPLLLVLPPLHCATPAVYKALKAPALAEGAKPRALADVARGLEKQLGEICRTSGNLNLYNSLTEASRAVEPGLIGVQNVLEKQYPGRWLMSGSGAVHFVVTKRDDDGATLQSAMDEVRAGIRVVNANTCALL